MPKTIKLLILTLCLMQPAESVFSMDQFLETCLRFASDRNKKLTVGEEQIKLSRTRTARSVRSFFPNLTFERQYSRGKSALSGVKKDEAGNVIKDEYQSESIGLKASQPIYEAGRIRSTYLYDSLMLKSSKYNYTKLREELFYNVKAAYYDFLTMRMEYNRLKETYEKIELLSKKVKIEYKAKAISQMELVEALIFRDKVENMFISAELNLSLSKRRLAYLINVGKLEDIPADPPESLPEDVPEISYNLDECVNLAITNNVDIKINALQIQMAEHKKKIIRSKVIPKVYIEGFYGRSGEVFVGDPIELASVWNAMGRVSWSLWGNSTEINSTKEETNPNEQTDPNARSDTSGYGIKFSLFDDLNYFVEAKEGSVGQMQSLATYDETRQKVLLEVEKSFNDYRNSLIKARTLKDEVDLRDKKLKLLWKKNQLYEVTTLQVMEETVKFAEIISAYTKAMAENYSAVSNIEKLIVMPLR